MHVQENAPSSPGRRILVVEDELLLAMDLEAILEEHGFDVLEPVRDVQGALKALEEDHPDIVTLDMTSGDNPPRPSPSVWSRIKYLLFCSADTVLRPIWLTCSRACRWSENHLIPIS